MSYDIHCYRSKIGRPDLDEAREAIEEDHINAEPESKVKKEELAKALTDHNPMLESFKLDYAEISKFQNITIDEAKKQFNYIELNPPEGDLVIQITINDNNAILTIPYWYRDEQAKQVFHDLMEYLKIIRRTAGYFVYDPQTDKAFDPLTTKIEGLDIYLQTTRQIGNTSKPWWKFW
jgi:hypothetical protein